MRLLLHELSACKFAAEEYAPAVDIHDIVPCLFCHLVDHTVVLGASNAGIVDHAVPRSSLDQPLALLLFDESAPWCPDALTHPTSLPL